MKNYFTCLAVLLFALSASAEQDLGNYTLWQGTFKVVDGQTTKNEETSKIPYITTSMDPAFKHGFILRSKDGSSFTARVHVRFPKPLKAKKPDGTIHEMTEYDSGVRPSIRGEYFNFYTLDDGDPSGVYKVEIFVDEKPVAALDFDVQPK